MLISTSAVTFQKAGGQVCYFCDVTGKQTVLQGCYITKSLTNEQTGTAQSKHSAISRYLPPKTSWGFTKAKLPRLPGKRKCPGCVFLECTVITREEEALEALPGGDIPQQGLGSGCRPDQQFPIFLHATIVFWLPKGCTVPTLLLQTIYSRLGINVTNIFGKSIVGEMAGDMPGWTLQPREASRPNSAGLGSGRRTATSFFWGRIVAKQYRGR